MSDAKQIIDDRIKIILGQWEDVYRALDTKDAHIREKILQREKERFHEFIQRMHNEYDHGRNKAVRHMAEIELNYFENVLDSSKLYLSPFLKGEGMNEQDVAEEVSCLRMEYILDTIEQSLRLLVIECAQPS